MSTFRKFIKFLSSLKNTRRLLLRLCYFTGTILLLSITSSWATTYYISPTGSDNANGLTEGTPWATFTKSYSTLVPGDTLLALDGTYNQQINPSVSGATNLPITFKAKNRGKAILEMASDGNAILVYSTPTNTKSNLIIDGFIARGHGEYAAVRVASSDNVTEAQMTNHITIKNTGAFGSANLTNIVVFDLGNSIRDCLFEDIWAYGFGRKALQVFGSLRVTIRRAVLRYDYWDGSGYKPNDPRSNFSGYNTRESVFENIIAIDSAPTPPGRSADRSAFTSSGNDTPALVSNSAYNKYRGLLSLNNYGNGLEVNGGTGTANHDNTFEDLIFWNSEYYGFNIHSNDDGAVLRFITAGQNGLRGIYINQYPSAPITNVILTNTYAYNNGSYGFGYDPNVVDTFENNSATDNGYGSDLEANYAPTLTYLISPTMINGRARGASMVNRYIDGVQSDTPLWPWPNEKLIKQHMCNPVDLVALGRVAANGENWEPAWCASNKSLTQYIWEYLGNPIPEDIYSSIPFPSPTIITIQ